MIHILKNKNEQMQQKIINATTGNFNLKSVIQFLFWLVIVGLTLLNILGFSLTFIIGGIPKHFGSTLFNAKIWFYLHIAGGTAAILIGPLQFWKTFRVKYVHLHRTLGKIYIIGSLLAAICLIRIFLKFGWGPTSPSQITVTTLWFLSTIAAWWTIKRKNVKAHRQFMARSYLFAFYFVAVRTNDNMANIFGFDTHGDVYLANSDWFTWVVPFIILEMYQSWWPVAKINYATKGKTS
jgi:uncharacterized membrane protein